LSKNKTGVAWQKDFYDHVIRKHEDVVAQVKYVLDNPVRKGLVSEWHDYPFTGSIGIRMDDVLNGIMYG
jgi:REP element-mobilizing transposase RayT